MTRMTRLAESSKESRTSPLLYLGVSLLGVGALLSTVLGANTYLPRLLMLGGVIVCGIGLHRSARALQFVLFRARAVAEPGPALSWILAGSLGLVLAVGFGLRGIRVDLTERGINRLSATSSAALAQLNDEIELVGAARETSPARGRIGEILEVYQAGSPRIRTRLIDPEREPEEARALLLTRGDVIVVRRGDVRQEVSILEEADLTQAILRVDDPSRPILGVLEGHGETAEGRAKLTDLRTLLTAAGLEYRTLRLSEMTDVPRAVRALLVPGPQTALLPGEVDAIARFLDGGGRAAIWIDPGAPTGLEEYLRTRGIEVDGRPIQDSGGVTQSVGLGPETIGINRFGDHPVTKGLSVGIVLPGATRVGLAATPVWGIDGADLLRTGSAARLAPLGDRPGAAAPAVISVAAALEWETSAVGAGADSVGPAERGAARLLVVGDSDFARNSGLGLYGNREFAARIFGWLSERSYLLEFPPIDRSGTPLRVGVGGLRAVAYTVQLAMPLLLFALAFRAWGRRR